MHLDDTGIAQATAAAERLDGLPLAAVVTSPLERCRETAKLMAPRCGPSRDRRLLECDYGEWTGQEIKRLAKEKLWRTVQAQPSGARFPGGESLQEMSARVVAGVRARDAAVEEEAGDHAVWLAVSHGDPIKAILADALGMHLDAFQRIVVDPGSLSVVRYTPHRAFVLTMNSGVGFAGPPGEQAPQAAYPLQRRGRRRRRRALGSATTAPLGSVPCRSSTVSTRPSASCRARSASPGSRTFFLQARAGQPGHLGRPGEAAGADPRRAGRRAPRRADPDRGRADHDPGDDPGGADRQRAAGPADPGGVPRRHDHAVLGRRRRAGGDRGVPGRRGRGGAPRRGRRAGADRPADRGARARGGAARADAARDGALVRRPRRVGRGGRARARAPSAADRWTPTATCARAPTATAVRAPDRS